MPSREPLTELQQNAASAVPSPGTPVSAPALQRTGRLSGGKAKARELGEKTFSAFKEKRLRSR
jgi:hypothetical protein